MPKQVNINGLWLSVAGAILKKKRSLSSKYFMKIFKLPYQLVELVWRKLRLNFPEDKHQHLLWTLHFLKTTDNNPRDIAALLGTNEKTLLSHVKIILVHLNKALPDVCNLLLCGTIGLINN
jgi:hypothetical protein